MSAPGDSPTPSDRPGSPDDDVPPPAATPGAPADQPAPGAPAHEGATVPAGDPPATPTGPPAPSPTDPAPGSPAQPVPGSSGEPVPGSSPRPAPGPYAPPVAPRPATTYAPPPAPTRPATPFSRAREAFWQGRADAAPSWVLGTALGVGALAGPLLVGHAPGLGAALVGIAVWAAAAPVLVRRRAWSALVLAALAVALVAVLAVRDAAWVGALCVLVAFLTAAVAVTSARGAGAVLGAALTGLAGVVRSLPWVRHGLGAVVGSRRAQVLVALRSVLVTVALLVVFGALFASADSVFASYLPRVDLGLLPAQVVVGVVVALGAATLAHLALDPPGWSDLRLPEGRPARVGEWLLPVGSLALLVSAFVLVQVGALVDGHRHVLRTLGLSYAEYARAGFAQLVVATALTLVVVGVAARRAPRATARDRVVVRVALGVLCVGTLGVVASALRRMDLYVEAFGLTRLRLLVLVAEAALGVVLLLVLAAGVRWRGRWLPVAVVHVVAVATLGLAAADPDALIARHNTTARTQVATDVAYLRGLSADAVPVLVRLDDPLRTCLLAGREVDAPRGIGDAHLARARAARVLRDLGVTEQNPFEACEVLAGR